MRGKLRLLLFSLVILIVAVSCQPRSYIYWWPDMGPSKPSEPGSDSGDTRSIMMEFLAEFNPGQALKDAEDESRDDISFENHDSADYVPMSSIVLRANTTGDGIIYRYVIFDGYKQSESGIALNSGYMVFAIDSTTAGDETGVKYTVSANDLVLENSQGEIVSDISVDETVARFEGITVEQGSGGEVVIKIDEEKLSSLPPSTTATAPSLNGESVMQSESDLSYVTINPEEAVRSLDITNVLRTIVSSTGRS